MFEHARQPAGGRRGEREGLQAHPPPPPHIPGTGAQQRNGRTQSCGPWVQGRAYSVYIPIVSIYCVRWITGKGEP